MSHLIGLHESFPDLLRVQVTADACRLDFASPKTTFSSAPWLGGFQQQMRGVLNLKVSKDAELDLETGEPEPLDKTFPRVYREQGMAERTVGMMTAASMKSFRFRYELIEDFAFWIGVTAGLDNARRIGDKADDTELHFSKPLPAGTINLMLVTNAPLSQAAALEAFALMTEAKTAACYDRQIISRQTGGNEKQLATGTGTDATLVAIPEPSGQPEILYCGKHTLLGERIGECAYDILADTLQACLNS